MLPVGCTGCGQQFQPAPHLAGTVVSCPNCNTAIAIPQDAPSSGFQPLTNPSLQPQTFDNSGTQFGYQAGTGTGKAVGKQLQIGIGIAVAVLLLVVVGVIITFSTRAATDADLTATTSAESGESEGRRGPMTAQVKSKLMKSSDNLRKIAVAARGHLDQHRFFPACYSTNAEGAPLLSWRVHLLPMLGEDSLYREFHLGEPWDSEHNIKLVDRMPKVFRAPISQAPQGKTTFRAIGGATGTFPSPGEDVPVDPKIGKIKGVTLGHVTDGLRNTVMIVEVRDSLAIEWTKPDEFVPDSEDPRKGIAGVYNEGMHMLCVDGTTMLVEVDASVAALLFHRHDGQVIPWREIIKAQKNPTVVN